MPPLFLGVTVGVLVCLVTISAFFSSSESAIFSLTDDWIDEHERTDDPRVATLQALRSDPHRLLVTILVGNNVVNVAIASITTVVAIEYLPAGSAITVATVVASFVVLVFGEIVPKSYGLGQSERWSLVVATPLSIAGRVLYPLVAVFDAVTRRVNERIGGETRIETAYLEE
ncbi:hypothetical protein GCM10028857_24070 [Salinarchaeum chitinilyticum]